MAVNRLELALPLRMGAVNVYLIDTPSGHVLIDTGPARARRELAAWLADRGVTDGSLALVALTHGDFDHTGNAAHLRDLLGAEIALGADDWLMAQRGRMFAGRSSGNRVMGSLAAALFGFGRAERFTPDLDLAPGSLDAFGLRVIAAPGHSSGSVALLTHDGDLFSGDLIECDAQAGPRMGDIIDDPRAAAESLALLQSLDVRRVFPGHGAPFDGEALQEILTA